MGLGGGPRVCISAGFPGAAASQGCPPRPRHTHATPRNTAICKLSVKVQMVLVLVSVMTSRLACETARQKAAKDCTPPNRQGCVPIKLYIPKQAWFGTQAWFARPLLCMSLRSPRLRVSDHLRARTFSCSLPPRGRSSNTPCGPVQISSTLCGHPQIPSVSLMVHLSLPSTWVRCSAALQVSVRTLNVCRYFMGMLRGVRDTARAECGNSAQPRATTSCVCFSNFVLLDQSYLRGSYQD